ncbi:alpha/beta fold hydrolase [Pollutimonas sp. M17]|uniref:alpha/beta fold hydrolase n=1 Tax=Pollutimonas sp. M17 TaxID=2962065 RepID=UPI0021F4CB6B|nr:alpha/beta hydrolase [Pollutimonas sp. M17]UYO94143.1 alpha/beta hydrolase [Pollutimonas sp. M17]
MTRNADELHCHIQGESGPELVILHPVGLDHTFMTSVMDAASQSYKTLGLDLRGHGSSMACHPETTLDTYVKDIQAAIRRHCTGKPIVLGLSFGGMLAQKLALDEPDAVAGLILCGCAGGFTDQVRLALRERGLKAQREGMGAVVDETIERWVTPAFKANPAVEKIRHTLQHANADNWSCAWHAIAQFDAMSRLGEIAIPALVIAGENDAATPLATTEQLAGAIPGAQHVKLAGAPHMMQIEAPDTFNATVLEFLRAHWDPVRPTGGNTGHIQ